MFLFLSIFLNVFLIFNVKNILLENLFLKTQLSAYKRKHKIFRPTTWERCKLVLLSYLNPNWKSSLLLVTPDTLLLWRKQKFKLFWKLLSKSKNPGRPNVPWSLIKLVRKIAKQNPIWGATKIHGVLLKLGFIISERSVSKYVKTFHRSPNPRKRLSWKNFYLLHSDSMIVSDLFTVFSYNFREIYKVIFFLDLKNRQILHFDISAKTSTAWVRRVIKYALKKKGLKNTSYVLTDNDCLFGKRFSRYLERLGIKHKKTAVRSPWQNGYAERFVKTCKNEFLDYFVPLNEYHLKVKLEEFIHFYNHNRTHLALDKDTPVSSEVLHKPRDGDYELASQPVLGGMYHTYSWKKVA
ncbi:integrase core domain-containing protein [Leptospira idonii]|uniref:Transposase n=1 Tax=Leptospira idonii TaxID=1193500 RepID=A0A4R9LZT2_9LEPT|nr:integrase core domain-containing protein [Leptospira idonii]TGN19282.1 transposase [Leptospira idonii]